MIQGQLRVGKRRRSLKGRSSSMVRIRSLDRGDRGVTAALQLQHDAG